MLDSANCSTCSSSVEYQRHLQRLCDRRLGDQFVSALPPACSPAIAHAHKPLPIANMRAKPVSAHVGGSYQQHSVPGAPGTVGQNNRTAPGGEGVRNSEPQDGPPPVLQHSDQPIEIGELADAATVGERADDLGWRRVARVGIVRSVEVRPLIRWRLSNRLERRRYCRWQATTTVDLACPVQVLRAQTRRTRGRTNRMLMRTRRSHCQAGRPLTLVSDRMGMISGVNDPVDH